MDSSVLANCSICRRKNLIPQDAFGTYCTRKGCEGWLLLRQIDNSKKYVRISCKNKYYYHLVDYDAKTVKCNCCGVDYDIIPYVVEIRSNQKVRSTIKNAEAKLNEAFNVVIGEVDKEDNVLNNLLETKHSDDEMKRDREEKKGEELKGWVFKQQQRDLREKTRKMERLEAENRSLLEKVAEMEEGLKTMGATNEELKEENLNLKEIINQKSNAFEETWKELEITKKESNKVMEKMKEINALIEVNFEMIQKLTSLSTEAKESKNTNCAIQASRKARQVPCEVCGEKATIPKDCWKAECRTKTCTSYTILAPVDERHRVVRHVCKNVPYFNRVENSEKSVRCRCCGRDFRITNVVVEMRNGQRVFHAGLRNLPETEVIMLRCQLKELEVQLDNEMEAANTEYQTLEQYKNEIEKENLDLKTNVACHTEINKMLMMKIKNIEATAEGAKQRF